MTKNSDITHDEGREESHRPASGIVTPQPGRLRLIRLVWIPELWSARRRSDEPVKQVMLTTRILIPVQLNYSRLQGEV